MPTFPHTTLCSRLKAAPTTEHSSWCDYWRGFWSGYTLSSGVNNIFLPELSDTKEWFNGYHSGDKAWKRENFRATKATKKKGKK